VRRARWAGALASTALAITAITAASAAVIQQDGIRITVLSQVKPFKLPREEPAPIAVFVSGHVATPSGELPPQLKRMTIRVNRNGLLQSRGLPTCPLEQVKTATTDRALAECEDALVGSGRFWASIVLPDQRPFPTRGRLLVFNGRQGGKPVLYSHIFTASPFPTSFVIAFAIRRISQGPYGTQLSAALPQALGSWGFVDRIKLTLKRKYRLAGKELSYFNAACPAPAGTAATSFLLAEASFYFAEREPISLQVSKACRVAE
jgi:hypothetical protein